MGLHAVTNAIPGQQAASCLLTPGKFSADFHYCFTVRTYFLKFG